VLFLVFEFNRHFVLLTKCC